MLLLYSIFIVVTSMLWWKLEVKFASNWLWLIKIEHFHLEGSYWDKRRKKNCEQFLVYTTENICLFSGSSKFIGTLNRRIYFTFVSVGQAPINIGRSGLTLTPPPLYFSVRPFARWIYVAYIHRWHGITDEYRGLGLSRGGGIYIRQLTDEYRWIRSHMFPFLSSPVPPLHSLLKPKPPPPAPPPLAATATRSLDPPPIARAFKPVPPGHHPAPLSHCPAATQAFKSPPPRPHRRLQITA
jgi:hypothetical protein